MKRASRTTIIILMLLALVLPSAAQAVADSAGSCILIHADSGIELYGHGEHDRRLIASVTKIMTALVVLERCGLSEKVEITPEYAAVEGSSMYLKPGGDYTVEQLLYGMLLTSGNDAATALACHAAGSVAEFAKLMNEKAWSLSLGDTSFENPHGLDGERQFSSAADLARLTLEALKNESFAKIVKTKTYTIGENTYVNHNKLLWSCEGVTGVKTGYTRAAGRTLVTCCERDGLRLICVTLCDGDDWNDHKNLYDWAYGEYEYVCPLPDGFTKRIPVVSGRSEDIGVCAQSGAKLLIKKGAEPVYRLELPRFVYGGIRRGERAGRAVFTLDGADVGEIPLVFTEAVERESIPGEGLGGFLKLFGFDKIGYILTREK